MKKFFLFTLLAATVVACSPEIVWDKNHKNQNNKPNSSDNNNENQNDTPNNDDSGYDDDYCIDWSPLFMVAYLHDTKGNNLLDIESKHYYDVSQIKVTYNGKEYDVKPPYQPSAKPLYYMAMFKEPYILTDYNGEKCLYIGEWDRIQDWENCSVEISWGDELKHVLSFSHEVTYNPEYANNPNKDFGYSFTTNWYLNGEPNNGCVYYFVKKW